MNAKIKIYGFTILLIGLLFSGCKNEPVTPAYERFATVVNPDSLSSFMLITDQHDRLWTETSRYKPKNRQRIITKFTVLEEMPAGSEYDYKIEMFDIYEILTKGIFKITPETQDSIGDEAVKINDLWIASDFLNIDFSMYVGDGTIKHYINLVSDKEKTYDDDKVHLEFRHNSNKDHSTDFARSIAAFDLLPLQENAAGDSLSIVIHYYEYGSTQMKEREITYKFNKEENEPVEKAAIVINAQSTNIE